MIALAAASGAMAMTVPMSAAFAADGGAAAEGAAVGSPGAISGNTIQVPVHAPVNVCGNTVNVVGLLNPAADNHCANASAGRDRASSAGEAARHEKAGEAARHEKAGTPVGHESGGAVAHASGKDSPGLLSGNEIQLPVHAPVNVSGNSVNVVGVGNPAVGNSSTNDSYEEIGEPAPEPPARAVPHPLPRPVTHPAPEPRTQESLAHTGADQAVPMAAASAALLLGGIALYRRHRPGATR
ncbi:chaplin [Streptomyces sp. NTH33]|uniref:chaplin n=1 Tax=Streptomyces sp. NTH33 TaxID=1735453 RepID=UPI002815FF97|nr:chaplin [Streptomyces sp. NTH33]